MTVLQYLQQLLSLSWVIIKADHYFLSDYTALIHCRVVSVASVARHKVAVGSVRRKKTGWGLSKIRER